ncbi:ATP-binding cassette domain-containing protein [Pseudoalteromonas luteoviolacea]|uniref:ATP-binding cassette domain-containing protein n=1 Tax=Pseudoalteromonas luteoviolacea TaxID=43657 RepID=UPI001EEE2918|nr:ATP-binding cassette domain-containing protein [Pseudoalteromonas luteoviolacea]MCF6442248.1 ATP-binding cassette domain-containing protein [Pseudoalteromonas luteoviolacea]
MMRLKSDRAVIQVKSVSKTYQGYRKPLGLSASLKNLFHREIEYTEAVKGVSFDIARGQTVAVVGQNGAGKTTTMKMLSGMINPTQGHITVFGQSPCIHKAAFKKRCSYFMGQSFQVWPDLPAMDSFNLCQSIYEIPIPVYKRRLSYLSEFLQVTHLLGIQVRRLSMCERIKMELIAALLHSPEVLFLDEPIAGLDYLSQRAIMRAIQHLAAEDKLTVLLSSHSITDLSLYCERALVMEGGRLVLDNDMHLAEQSLQCYAETI